jgi:type IX secretion system PorP/SprF family membrane protein
MNKKIIILVNLLFAINLCVLAQQDPLLTHFSFNKMALNPGSTGLDDGFCATTIYRNQWDKVSGAPNSAVLNLEGNMNRFFPGGVGVNFYHDAIGFGRQNNLMLNYSYPLKIGEDKLGIGLGLGILNFGLKPTWITPDNNNFDKSIPETFSATGLDINFGLYYQSSKRFYIGISGTHLNSSNLKQSVTQGNSTYDQIYKVARHLYVMAGYKTNPIGPGNIDFQTMLRSDLNKYSLDLNAKYTLSKIGYAGMTYRTSDAIAIMLGFIPMINMTVGYSYDLTLSKLSSVSRGSHEVLLKYCYYLPIPPVTVTRNPRWL